MQLIKMSLLSPKTMSGKHNISTVLTLDIGPTHYYARTDLVDQQTPDTTHAHEAPHPQPSLRSSGHVADPIELLHDAHFLQRPVDAHGMCQSSCPAARGANTEVRRVDAWVEKHQWRRGAEGSTRC